MDTPKKCYLNSKQCTLLRSNLAAQLALTTNRLAPHPQQLYLAVGRIIFDRSCDHEQSWRAALIHDWPLTFLLAVFSSTSCFAPGFTGALVWLAGPSWTRRGLSYQPCFPNELQRRSLTLLSPVSCPDYFSPSRHEECGLGTRPCRYEQNGGTLLL